MLNNIVELVVTLKKNNMLPALIFSLNRQVINWMLRRTTNYLEKNDVRY